MKGSVNAHSLNMLLQYSQAANKKPPLMTERFVECLILLRSPYAQ